MKFHSELLIACLLCVSRAFAASVAYKNGGALIQTNPFTTFSETEGEELPEFNPTHVRTTLEKIMELVKSKIKDNFKPLRNFGDILNTDKRKHLADTKDEYGTPTTSQPLIDEAFNGDLKKDLQDFKNSEQKPTLEYVYKKPRNKDEREYLANTKDIKKYEYGAKTSRPLIDNAFDGDLKKYLQNLKKSEQKPALEEKPFNEYLHKNIIKPKNVKTKQFPLIRKISNAGFRKYSVNKPEASSFYRSHFKALQKSGEEQMTDKSQQGDPNIQSFKIHPGGVVEELDDLTAKNDFRILKPFIQQLLDSFKLKANRSSEEPGIQEDLSERVGLPIFKDFAKDEVKESLPTLKSLEGDAAEASSRGRILDDIVKKYSVNKPEASSFYRSHFKALKKSDEEQMTDKSQQGDPNIQSFKIHPGRVVEELDDLTAKKDFEMLKPFVEQLLDSFKLKVNRSSEEPGIQEDLSERVGLPIFKAFAKESLEEDRSLPTLKSLEGDAEDASSRGRILDDIVKEGSTRLADIKEFIHKNVLGDSIRKLTNLKNSTIDDIIRKFLTEASKRGFNISKTEGPGNTPVERQLTDESERPVIPVSSCNLGDFLNMDMESLEGSTDMKHQGLRQFINAWAAFVCSLKISMEADQEDTFEDLNEAEKILQNVNNAWRVFRCHLEANIEAEDSSKVESSARKFKRSVDSNPQRASGLFINNVAETAVTTVMKLLSTSIQQFTWALFRKVLKYDFFGLLKFSLKAGLVVTVIVSNIIVVSIGFTIIELTVDILQKIADLLPSRAKEAIFVKLQELLARVVKRALSRVVDIDYANLVNLAYQIMRTLFRRVMFG